ncbi:hypothetical protein [Acinetobacter terrestris]|uniref:Uncharacterized protein n=1 Tax=Acinetobacter terrestris TaxID=2529843 RepID=A0ABX1USR2_9GAMM|nr:hypothetical protein [Acinetobacter terrestris]NNH25149.1 hypothetical protein [Acinetobacter terrestris]
MLLWLIQKNDVLEDVPGEDIVQCHCIMVGLYLSLATRINRIKVLFSKAT